VGQLDKEGIQARDCCVAKNATLRADRPDPSLRRSGLLRMTRNYQNLRVLALLPAALLLAACSGPAKTPEAVVAEASVRLQAIPAANPDQYKKLNIKAWRNPYLIVKADSVGLLDVANHEEHRLKPEELSAVLANLPQSAWPYGRVVALAESQGQGSHDDSARIRDVRAKVASILHSLEVQVYWVPST
jgi:hypothetical protein